MPISLPASLADNIRSRAGSVYNSNNTDYTTIEAGLVLAVMLHGCWCRRWVTCSCCNPSECMLGVHPGWHCSQWLPECHWIKCSCMATLDKHDVGQQATVQTDHWRSASWIVPESELVLWCNCLGGRRSPQLSVIAGHLIRPGTLDCRSLALVIFAFALFFCSWLNCDCMHVLNIYHRSFSCSFSSFDITIYTMLVLLCYCNDDTIARLLLKSVPSNSKCQRR